LTEGNLTEGNLTEGNLTEGNLTVTASYDCVTKGNLIEKKKFILFFALEKAIEERN
jgi:hypothetical protein